MSDPCHLTVTVLTVHAARTKVLMEAANEESNTESEQDRFTVFEFEEVNCGELRVLADLRAAGIAYNQEWGDGDEFTSGTLYSRYLPTGEAVQREIYEVAINPDLWKLMDLLDEPAKLVAFIRQHHEGMKPLPWDNQEEYGNRHRTLQLIAPGVVPPLG